jgi:hypothetical protein
MFEEKKPEVKNLVILSLQWYKEAPFPWSILHDLFDSFPYGTVWGGGRLKNGFLIQFTTNNGIRHFLSLVHVYLINMV